MQIDELLAALRGRAHPLEVRLAGNPSGEVLRADHDSRQVQPGSLYCCVSGAAHDGHDFAAAAVAAGATALLCERQLPLDVPQLLVASVRSAMGPTAAAIMGEPSRRLDVIGVTGTNGKTTVTHLLASIMEAAHRPCGLIGTLTGTRTTPEAPELQRSLADMADAGDACVAMEVSSHALDLHRVDGTRFAAAVFTNLSQDHLDHHGTMASYFAAKARLFTPELTQLAVVNLDDPYGRLLRDAATVPTVGYSLDDVADLEMGPAGSSFTWRGTALTVGLPGRFNVSNALAAATVAAELGVDLAAIAAGLADAGAVDGRFERVDGGQPFLAAVDYAHTPDGLRKLLESARELASDRVILVFGAGGDRDHGKRPQMGEAAAELADVVFLTTDNPRSEDPAAIISAVQRGMNEPTDLRIEPDRALAIAGAVAVAGPGDVLLVAGKGHESVQVFASGPVPFSDRDVLVDALAGAGYRSSDGASR